MNWRTTSIGLRKAALAAALVAAGGQALAQAPSPFSGPGASSAPVEITADLFEITEASRQAVFSGNVVVTQAGFRLTSARVEVSYGEGGQTDLRSLTSPGATRIAYQGQTATGDRAEFDVASRVLRMTGNVRVQNTAGTFSGPLLVIDFARGTSSFGGGRVTGVFTPGG